jgi:hypothetical protein
MQRRLTSARLTPTVLAKERKKIFSASQLKEWPHRETLLVWTLYRSCSLRVISCQMRWTGARLPTGVGYSEQRGARRGHLAPWRAASLVAWLWAKYEVENCRCCQLARARRCAGRQQWWRGHTSASSSRSAVIDVGRRSAWARSRPGDCHRRGATADSGCSVSGRAAVERSSSHRGTKAVDALSMEQWHWRKQQRRRLPGMH